MRVEAVDPSSAAADPAHPDHDRWVKDRTLKMEAEHAARVGLPYAVAESENARLLARMEILAKLEPAAPAEPTAPRETRDERMEARGVVVRKPKKQKARRRRACACGGVCVGCRLQRRVLAIMKKAHEGDPRMKALAAKLFGASIDASRLTGAFRGMSRADASRSVTAKIMNVADASVASLGAWR